MATKTKKRRAAPKRAAKRNPASNPAPRRRRATHRRRNPSARRRRNPSVSRAAGSAGSLMSKGIICLMALVGTKQIPQMALGASNTGWMGYAANAVTAFAIAFGARKFIGAQAYLPALAGGGAYTVSRILNEQLSPFGQYLQLSGVGDPAAVTSLEGIVPGSYMTPTNYLNGQPVIPPHLQSAFAPPPPPAGVAGLNRYASTAMM